MTVRTCTYCGAKLTRRKGEKWDDWKRRAYCGMECRKAGLLNAGRSLCVACERNMARVRRQTCTACAGADDVGRRPPEVIDLGITWWTPDTPVPCQSDPDAWVSDSARSAVTATALRLCNEACPVVADCYNAAVKAPPHGMVQGGAYWTSKGAPQRRGVAS